MAYNIQLGYDECDLHIDLEDSVYNTDDDITTSEDGLEKGEIDIKDSTTSNIEYNNGMTISSGWQYLRIRKGRKLI